MHLVPPFALSCYEKNYREIPLLNHHPTYYST